MKQKLLPLLLALSLLLTGCGWMDGRYSSVTPHLEQRQDTQPEVIVASDYLDLMDALEDGPDFLDSFDAELFDALVEKIIVDSNERLRFRLKNGLELPEQIERTRR